MGNRGIRVFGKTYSHLQTDSLVKELVKHGITVYLECKLSTTMDESKEFIDWDCELKYIKPCREIPERNRSFIISRSMGLTKWLALTNSILNLRFGVDYIPYEKGKTL